MNKLKRNERGRHLQPPTRCAGLAEVASVPVPPGEFWASWEAERKDRVAQLEESSREPLMAQDLRALTEIDIALRDQESSIFQAWIVLVDSRTGAERKHSLPVAALLLEKRDVLAWLVALALATGPWEIMEALECALDLLDASPGESASIGAAKDFLRRAIARYEHSRELAPLMETLADSRASGSPGMEFVLDAVAEIAAGRERVELQASVQHGNPARELAGKQLRPPLRL